MQRRTVLHGTALAGIALLAGCGGGDGSDGTGSPARDSETGGTSVGESAADPATDPSPTSATAASVEGTLPESEVVDLSGPPCEAVAGATFRSVEKREGGPTGPGTSSGIHWRVSFEDGTYEYAHSDVVESGSYTCSVENGTAVVEGSTSSDLTYSGSYDPDSGVLVWDEVRYRPVGDS